MTTLTIHVKDLTKPKAKFVKQSRPAFVSGIGGITWGGKAPSKRFSLYASGGGAKSKTVTVTARR